MKELVFINPDHEDFYMKNKTDSDVYRNSLFYLIGLTEDTRNHFLEIYSEGGINRSVINSAWVTGETMRLLILGFNLFNGYRYGYSDPKNDEIDYEDFSKDQLIEMVKFGFRNNIDWIFSGGLGYYYFQAINIRFKITEGEKNRKELDSIIERMSTEEQSK